MNRSPDRRPPALLLAAALFGVSSAAPARAEPPPDALEDAIAASDTAAALRRAREMAAAEAGATREPLARAARLEALADRLTRLSGPEVAAFVEEQLVRSLELREGAEGPGQAGHLDTLGKLSEVYFTAGRWERAEEMDRRCLSIKLATLDPRHPGVADAQRNLALSLFNQGKLEAAEALIREAVVTLESLPDAKPLAVAYAVSDLADNLRAQNRYREATPLFERSLALAESAVGSSHPELVSLLVNLGGLYRDTNRFGESAWRLGQAQQIALGSDQVGPSERVSLWNNLAELHRLQGNYPEAERLYKVAIETTRGAFREDHPKLATYENQLGELLSEIGRFAEAEPLFEDALARRIRNLGADHLDVAYTQKCLGQMRVRAGRPGPAEEALRRALAIQEGRLGASHPEVGTTRLALAETLERSPARAGEARLLVDSAVAILDGTPAEPRAQARAYSLRATLERRGGEPSRARVDLARALAILEGLRPEAGGGEQTRALAFARTQGEFQRMVAWQIEAGDLPAAFSYAERARGRVLLDQLAGAGVDLRGGIEPAERQRLEAREALVQSRLAEHRERLRSLGSRRRGPAGSEAEAEALVRGLAEAAAEFQSVYEEIKNASRYWRSVRAGDGGTIGLDRVQKHLLGPGSRMLFYVVGEEQSFLFDIPPAPQKAGVLPLTVGEGAARMLGIDPGPLDAPRLRRALIGAEPDGSLGLVQELTSPPPRGRRRLRLESALHALWQVLVPPSVSERLMATEEVVLVPDGLLHQLPFEALVPDLRSGDTPSRFWLDTGPPIRYAASATALDRLSELRPGVKEGGAAGFRIVSVSDPVFGEASFGGRTLERLPGTARESQAIRTAYAEAAGRTQVLVLQGQETREAAVRAALPGARYLHLATHGLVDESHGGLLATLALTPPSGPAVDPTDDGQLQLHEIYALPLHAELAVLSSCESRVGGVVAGEGVFALSRAFLAAGSRRVVASLWPAEDESTAQVVSEFFRAVAAADTRHEDADFTAALAQAKRAVRARSPWADPFFWAPFVLEGVR